MFTSCQNFYFRLTNNKEVYIWFSLSMIYVYNIQVCTYNLIVNTLSDAISDKNNVMLYSIKVYVYMYVQIFSTQTRSNSMLEAKIVDQLLFNVFLHSKIGNATNNFISIGNKVCLKNNSRQLVQIFFLGQCRFLNGYVFVYLSQLPRAFIDRKKNSQQF